MSVLQLKLLGRMECRLPSGDLLTLPTRKTEVLLAYLALNSGIRHPREKLTSLLWSDRGEDQARNSLRQTLSRIKKELAQLWPDFIDADRNTVMLPSAHADTDVGRFELLVKSPSLDNLSQAVNLYGGELLEGILIRDNACQEWLDIERDRLRRLVVAALCGLCEQYNAQQQYSHAIETGERLVTFDALHENGWRQLMMAYYLNGDRNHALQTYQRCCNILDIELGVKPDSRTDELYRRLLQDDMVANDFPGREESQPSRGGTDPAGSPTDNIVSRDYFLQGWFHAEKHNRHDTEIAIEQFRKSIEIDPLNSSAHAILAAEYHVLLFENWTPNRQQTLELSRRHLEEALALRPDDALTQAFMSEHYLIKKNFDGAMSCADRALSLNPELPDSCSMKALVLAYTRQYAEAVKYADLSLQLAPHHPYSGWNAGAVYRSAGQYQQALKIFRRIPHLPPSVYATIAVCLVGAGDIEEARQVMAQYQELCRQQMLEYPANRSAWRQLWFENIAYQSEQDFDQFFDMLLQAGLCNEASELQRALPSIAVLPFENLSADSSQDFFCDGIVTDIVSILSRVKSMRVVARYSTLQYKNSTMPLMEIAEQQNVRYLLGGSVRASGKHIRVNVELMDSSNDEICWAELYDRNMDDLFAVQDDITRNIIGAIRGHFYGGGRDRQRTSGTQSLKAWELCLQATDLQDSYIKANVIEARKLAKKALLFDSNYCYAWVTLGWTYWQEVFCGWTKSPDQALREASKAAQMALDMNAEFAEAWALEGLISVMEGKPDQAILACRKAVDLAPGNAEVQALLACALCYAGEYQQAQVAYQKAIQQCPNAPNWYILIGGVIDLFFGRTEQAIEKFQLAIEIEPESPLCRYYLIDALVEAGDLNAAKSVLNEIRQLEESIRVTGIIRLHSFSKKERNRFLHNLEKAGLSIKN